MKRMVKILLGSTVYLASMSLGPVALAQEPDNPDGDPVIEYYTQRYNVSAEEAATRLARAPEIIKVQRELEAKFPNQFGGLYEQHGPEFRVVVLMTGNGEGLLRTVTQDPLFVVQKADRPINQLVQTQGRAFDRLREAGVGSEVSVDMLGGKVIVGVTVDPAIARAALDKLPGLDEYVVIRQIASLPFDIATITGGVSLIATDGQRNCTTGFPARRSGVDGIITAAHCGNTATISGVTGVTVPTGAEYDQSSETTGYDVQFMTKSGHTWPNTIITHPGYTMNITVVYDPKTLPQNHPVCVFGTATNVRRCGNFEERPSKVTSSTTGRYGIFHRIKSTDNTPMAKSGDSGGPVFGNGSAYGIMKSVSGTYPNDVFFMSIMDIGVVNATVKTAP